MNALEMFARQYRASLEMLGQAVAQCPEPLWLAPDYPNKFWHIAYHTLFFTHLYLQTSEAEFRPWLKHKKDYQFLGPRPWAPHEVPEIGAPYSKEDILEYHQFCLGETAARVPSVDLDAPSGFHWLPFNKAELQVYNIRHIQHHAGQLIDRLRTAEGIGTPWVIPR
jgi:hypothetical protein